MEALNVTGKLSRNLFGYIFKKTFHIRSYQQHYWELSRVGSPDIDAALNIEFLVYDEVPTKWSILLSSKYIFCQENF